VLTTFLQKLHQKIDTKLGANLKGPGMLATTLGLLPLLTPISS